MVKCPLNYIGGKTKLLPQILPLFPKEINTFVDLFAGGFNVGINVDAKHYIYNDLQTEVKEMIEMFYKHSYESMDETLHKIIETFNIPIKNIEQLSDEEKKEKKEKYLEIRNYYNSNKNPILLFLLVCYSFSNQIRFNSKGLFNMPCGKRYYNSSIQKNLKEFSNSIKAFDIQFFSEDYRKWLDDNLQLLNEKDFIYLDPPYLISSAVYNSEWNEDSEKDLLRYIDKINEKGVKWALSNVLENNNYSNDILKEWSKKYNVHHLNYTYSNCNYHRTSKGSNDSDEVLITNY